MNYQKDTNHNISAGGDRNQGQSVQSDASAVLVKSVDEFPRIGQKPFHLFLQKKSEKLVSAIYLITGFVSDNEPLKWDLRKVSLSIMSDITALEDVSQIDTDVRLRKIIAEIEKISALLGVSKIAGFVSEMNYVILHEEYHSLSSSVSSERINTPQKNFVFSRDFFKEVETLPVPTQEISKGQIKDKEPNVLYQAPKPLVQKITSQPVTERKPEKNSRRELILNLIKDKREVSIKDVVSHFSDIGEKTIQRELAVLVATGELKKEGDRRWSKYLLP